MDTQTSSFYAATLIFVLTSNLMLIYGFYKTSRPFTIITKLFIYLSLVDIDAITIVVLVYAIPKVTKLDPSFFIALANALIFPTFFMEMFIFWTISFLRFLSIYKPMYRVKTRKVYFFLLVEFLISFLIGIVIFWTYMSVTFTKLQLINTKMSISLQLAITFMNFSLNMSSLIILRRSTNSKAQQKGDSVLGNQMVIKRKKMALNTLLLITIVHLFCTLPLTLVSFYPEFIMNTLFKAKFSVFGFCQCLQISSFGFNSMIVILRTKNLSEFYKTKCCCFTLKVNSNVENGMELN